MKYLPPVAGLLLGLLFVASSLFVLLGMAPTPEIPKDTAPYHFMQAFGPTGYLTFVKIVELIGGLLVIVPLTRRLGLLFLGPVILNILAFHLLVAGDGIFQVPLLVMVVLALFLVWADRGKWKNFLP